MIEINTQISSKPEIIPGGRRLGMQYATVPVTKVRNSGYNGSPTYEGLVFNNKENAPYNGEWPEGELWIWFMKSRNKHARIPVLKPGQIVEV